MYSLDLSSNSKFDNEISELFTKICYKNRNNFNYLIKDLTQGYNSNIDLLVSNPSSRNTHNSNLYLDFCKVQLVIHLLSVGELINEIIVDSKDMHKVLKQVSGLDKTKITLKRKKIKSTLKEISVILVLPLRDIIIRIYHLLLFKTIFIHKFQKPDHPITLIDTYALPGYYSKDRYYNGLWQSLNNEEKKDIYFVPTIVMTKWNKIYSAYKDLLKSERQFLFKESFLKFSDILFAVAHPLRVHFIKINGLVLNGIDYLPLVKKDLRHGTGYGLAIGGLINYRFIKRLKEKKIIINRVIDWWESQALDKGLHKGLNDHYPEVPVIGYLGYAPRNLELQLFPTIFEQENNIVPKEIAVIGKGFVNGMKIFNPNQKATHAPAFRFQHLWNGESHSPDKETYTILIALPVTFDDSVHIIKQMITCIDKVSMGSLRFWVKLHPTMPENKLKREFVSIWPKSFEFIAIDTQTALRKADILVSGMSSICLETIALGVPVLVIDQPRGLQYNPIPDKLEQDLWKQCSSSQDILDGIEHYRKRDEEELVRHKQLGLQIRKTYFEPVTRVGVLKFLGIEGEYNIAKS